MFSRIRSESAPWWAKNAPDRPVRILRQIRQRVFMLLLMFAFIAPLVYAAVVNPALAVLQVPGGGVRQPPSLTALADSCTGVTTWPVNPNEVGWIDEAVFSFAWRVVPPSSGNFSSKPWVGDRFVKTLADEHPTVEQAVALLYRGWIVLWFNPNTSPDRLEPLYQSASKMLADNEMLLIAPWPLDTENLWPKKYSFVFTSWSKTLKCGTFSEPLLEQFLPSVIPAPGIGVPLASPGPQAMSSTQDVLNRYLG